MAPLSSIWKCPRWVVNAPSSTLRHCHPLRPLPPTTQRLAQYVKLHTTTKQLLHHRPCSVANSMGPPGSRPPNETISSSPPSVEEQFLNTMRALKHDKWGWVFYRCTYGDDEAWARFQQLINERTRMFMDPELMKRLEWTFVSDPATLNGATRKQLRRRFRTWAADACRREQPRATPENAADSSRYSSFIQVNEESLRSVVDADPNDGLDVGWVNLVLAHDNVLNLPDLPATGMSWMRISTNMLEADRYYILGTCGDSWYPFYVPPPDVVYH